MNCECHTPEGFDKIKWGLQPLACCWLQWESYKEPVKPALRFVFYFSRSFLSPWRYHELRLAHPSVSFRYTVICQLCFYRSKYLYKCCISHLKKSELRNCANVEVAVLGSPSLIVLVSVDVKWHEKKISRASVQFVCSVYSWLQINLASDVFISPTVLVSCNASVCFTYIVIFFLKCYQWMDYQWMQVRWKFVSFYGIV